MPRVYVNPDGTILVEYKITTYRGDTSLPNFEIAGSALPKRKDASGKCLRCKWRANVAAKTVTVDTSITCECDVIDDLKMKLKSADRNVALDAMLAIEKKRQGI